MRWTVVSVMSEIPEFHGTFWSFQVIGVFEFDLCFLRAELRRVVYNVDKCMSQSISAIL